MSLDRVDSMDPIRLARMILDQPPFQAIVARAVKDAGVQAGGPANRLASHMALAYAQGYLQGWNRARRERSDFVPPPTVGDA